MSNEKKQGAEADVKTVNRACLSDNEIDSLAELIDLIAKDNTELMNISNHIRLMNESLVAILHNVFDMNKRLVKLARTIQLIAEYKAEQEQGSAAGTETVQADENAQNELGDLAEQEKS